MDKSKIKLEILGLSYSQTQTGAYALVLGESTGKRRLPIIIGNFEAQAIAIELEKMRPSRPLTHDIFKDFADAFEIKVTEVIIYNLVEGIFFAKLICVQKDRSQKEIDTRTSDAIALAVRFKCPIYTYENILASAGIVLEEEEFETEPAQIEQPKDEASENTGLRGLSMSELEEELEKALSAEDYERATILRDEINKRK
ncbi:MAG: bifunctional nuclease family protein [Flavobacteriales bacterium]